ncbi:hypothetical protein E2542_SST22887 [Spatholobus suberectus]|nr:hypothetical protein E2542_SST22887 [Spatholobus suberectus]
MCNSFFLLLLLVLVLFSSIVKVYAVLLGEWKGFLAERENESDTVKKKKKKKKEKEKMKKEEVSDGLKNEHCREECALVHICADPLYD